MRWILRLSLMRGDVAGFAAVEKGFGQAEEMMEKAVGHGNAQPLVGDDKQAVAEIAHQAAQAEENEQSDRDKTEAVKILVRDETIDQNLHDKCGDQSGAGVKESGEKDLQQPRLLLAQIAPDPAQPGAAGPLHQAAIRLQENNGAMLPDFLELGLLEDVTAFAGIADIKPAALDFVDDEEVVETLGQDHMGDAGHFLARQLGESAAGAVSDKTHLLGGVDHVEHGGAVKIGLANLAGMDQGSIAAEKSQHRAARPTASSRTLADQRIFFNSLISAR